MVLSSEVTSLDLLLLPREGMMGSKSLNWEVEARTVMWTRDVYPT